MGRPREFDEAAVLIAARDAFWEHGYVNAGVQEICTATGLNPGSIYGTFGDKRTLFLRAMRHYLDEVKRDGLDLIAGAETGESGLRKYFANVINWIESGHRRYGCFGTNSFIEVGASDPDVNQMMSEHFELLHKAFAKALRRDGFKEPAKTARFFVCVAQGLNVLARTSPNRAAMEAMIAPAFAILETKR